MTRSHRRWHFSLWLLIAPLLIAGFALGIAFRPHLDGGAPPPSAHEVQP